MAKVKKQKIGVYVEVVVHGHGCHEIVAAYDFPIERVEELQPIFDKNPLFTPRK
jgi:hypothetical protein